MEESLDCCIRVVSKTTKLLGLIVGGTCCGYGVWVAYRRYGAYAVARAGKKRAEELRAGGELYECSFRDPLEQEEADTTVEESVEDSTSLCSGPSSGSSRGPTTRRRARKQKAVHVDDRGRVLDQGYYGSVVAEARVHYAARGYSDYNAELARSYMVRLMQKHGVRPSQIDDKIESMVNAVFVITEAQRLAYSERGAMTLWGYIGLTKNK